jgi:uroporphyrinogen-III synthase
LHRPVLVHPVINIAQLDPLQITAVGTGETVAEQDLQPPACVVAVSGHAVTPYIDLRRRVPSLFRAEILHIAVGRQTARMLEKHAIIAALPEQMDSEGILSMPELRQLDSGAVVWLVAGRDGRAVLGNELCARGHQVIKIASYERVPNDLSTIDPQAISVIVAASEQGLRLAAACWQGQQDCRSVTIVAPSQRVCDVAEALGYSDVINAGGATPADVLMAVRNLQARH